MQNLLKIVKQASPGYSHFFWVCWEAGNGLQNENNKGSGGYKTQEILQWMQQGMVIIVISRKVTMLQDSMTIEMITKN